MSDCLECGMRDDDWFLCRRNNCAVRQTESTAVLERQIAELREQSDRYCDKYLAALKRAEAAEARADALAQEVESLKKAFTPIIMAYSLVPEGHRQSWYDDAAAALGDRP